ncbi:MAG: phosphotransferase family protein [Deltaproteobacteria bacterium]
MSPDEMVARLEPVFRAEAGADAARISAFRTMTGGAVRSAFSFDLELARGGMREHQELVLLAFRPGGVSAFGAPEEFALLRVLHAAGVPVPRPVHVGEEAIGRPFYVMERIAGESIGRRIVKDEKLALARQRLPVQLAQALAGIHRVDPATAELAFLPRPQAEVSHARHAVDQIEALYRMVTLEPHPVFELALRWLLAHEPPSGGGALVHGDFRIGNILVAEDGLRAVLDWELAHIGDPIEDLGWLCGRSWRFGRDELTCGGVGDRAALVIAYEQASGRPVDTDALRWWEVYGNLRWGVFTLVQVRPFLDGQSRNIELGMIGRRAAETEWELLNLMEGKAL